MSTCILSTSRRRLSNHTSTVLSTCKGKTGTIWNAGYVTSKDETPRKQRSLWTEAEDAIVIRSRNEGKTTEQIASLLPGRTTAAVRMRCRYYLNETGQVVNLPTQNRKAFSPEEDARLLAERSRGLSWTDMTTQFPGRSIATLAGRWRYLHQEHADNTIFGNTGAKFAPEDDRRIVEMRHDQRLPFAEIAKALGRSRGSVVSRYHTVVPSSGKNPRKNLGTLDAADFAQFKALVSQKKRPSEIARLMERHQVNVERWIMDWEYEQLVSPIDPNHAKRHWTSDEVHRLTELRAAGCTTMAIALELRRRPSSVINKLWKLSRQSAPSEADSTVP